MNRIIGIGGVSQSGKSTLARRIKEQLPNLKVMLIEMDNHVFAEVPQINGQADWENPDSVDYDAIISILNKNQEKHDLIIVEGILVFANDELSSLYDLTLLVEISKSTFLERRKKETRWGYEPEWYVEHVWEAYLKHGKFKDADIAVSGEDVIATTDISKILNKLR